MFYKRNNDEYATPLKGIHFKTLVYGDRTSLHKFRLDRDTLIPMHSHPHEQTGYLISGRMNFILKDKTILLESGDSWSIPGGEEHGAEVIENCILIEIFSPAREEYIRKIKE